MAVRYSGDTEIRVVWEPRAQRFAATVKDPTHRWSGHVRGRAPQGPDGYDAAALLAFQAAERAEGRFDAVREDQVLKLRRVFQAPCPCGPAPTRRRSRVP